MPFHADGPKDRDPVTKQYHEKMATNQHKQNCNPFEKRSCHDLLPACGLKQLNAGTASRNATSSTEEPFQGMQRQKEWRNKCGEL